jgi:Ni/Fe-hydrogenase subunit HybB-like protein
VSLLATSYTGFLFAQGVARDLWQGPHAAFDLIAQAVIEGAAAMLIALAIVPSLRAGGNAAAPLILALGAALAVHLLFLAIEHLTPSPTRHHELATRAISRGAFAPYFWGGAIVGGGLLPRRSSRRCSRRRWPRLSRRSRSPAPSPGNMCGSRRARAFHYRES